jgi:hypothetical protein
VVGKLLLGRCKPARRQGFVWKKEDADDSHTNCDYAFNNEEPRSKVSWVVSVVSSGALIPLPSVHSILIIQGSEDSGRDQPCERHREDVSSVEN